MNDEILGMLKELKPEGSFETSGSFIEDELLDSFDIVSLISMLEERYRIVVDGLEIVPENFGSIDAIVNLVNKSRTA